MWLVCSFVYEHDSVDNRWIPQKPNKKKLNHSLLFLYWNYIMWLIVRFYVTYYSTFLLIDRRVKTSIGQIWNYRQDLVSAWHLCRWSFNKFWRWFCYTPKSETGIFVFSLLVGHHLSRLWNFWICNSYAYQVLSIGQKVIYFRPTCAPILKNVGTIWWRQYDFVLKYYYTHASFLSLDISVNKCC